MCLVGAKSGKESQAIEELIQQAFEQYGLVGLVIAFLVLGPGFTYVRTKNNRLAAENTAQELLNTFLIEEREHAEKLEAALNDTLNKLEGARSEVFHLRMELAATQHQLNAMPDLGRDVQTLTKRMTALEEQMGRLSTQLAGWKREERVVELEAMLSGAKATPKEGPSEN